MQAMFECERCGHVVMQGDIFFELSAKTLEACEDGSWILGFSDKGIMRDALRARTLCSDCWADVVELIEFGSVRGAKVVK